MTEYERGFIDGFTDGVKSKVSAELTPTLINVSKTMLKILEPVLSTALENALNDNNAITDTDVQPVRHGRWTYPYKDKDINQCSECHSYVQDKISNVREMFAYCPFCGARMDGDTND
jgi:formamidopyrimidine-DNA glycosylase